MKTALQLKQKVSELEVRLTCKREELASALVSEEGDVSKLLAEVARLEGELSATLSAVKIAQKREDEQAERERLARLAEASKKVDDLSRKGEELVFSMLKLELDILKRAAELNALDAEQSQLIGVNGLKKVSLKGQEAYTFVQACIKGMDDIKNKLDFMSAYSRDNRYYQAFWKDFSDALAVPAPFMPAPQPDKHPKVIRKPVKEDEGFHKAG